MNTACDCGCCEGTEIVTPMAIANRPGLPALSYRVGTHATFLETMLARLSSLGFPELTNLTTRDPGDPAIALLDTWATVADVLAFYQERLANEGYLRTATERRSVLELARLVGYAPRPGVASSVFLAYTIDEDRSVNPPKALSALIPAGSRAQSVPGPGELPQSFETAEELRAHSRWNSLRPRMSRPQQLSLEKIRDPLFLRGISTNLKPNDPLLFVFGDQPDQRNVRRILTVEPNAAAGHTKITFEVSPVEVVTTTIGSVLSRLEDAPSPQPASALGLQRRLETGFAPGAETIARTLTAFRPELRQILPAAMAHAVLDAPPRVEVYAFRVKASPFGHNAPLKPITGLDGRVEGHEEWPLSERMTIGLSLHVGHLLEGPTVGVFIERNGRKESRQFEIDNPASGGDIADTRFEFRIETHGGLRTVALTVKETKLTVTVGVEQSVEVVGSPTQGKSIRATIPFSDIQAGKGFVSAAAEGHLLVAQVVTPEGEKSNVLISLAVPQPPTSKNVIALDSQYDQVANGSWVMIAGPGAETVTPPVVENPEPGADTPRALVVAKAVKVSSKSLARYGISGKTTEVALAKDWLEDTDLLLTVIRETTVFAQSELLELAEAPIVTALGKCGQEGSHLRIELDGLYDDLDSGRWLIVSGEREIPGTSGVRASELVMVAEVEHGVDATIRGDKIHSFVTLAAEGLAYCYKRESVRIYGNAVRATHGETRKEILGSGDASKALLSFPLRQPPLTYVSSPNPEGVASTLSVRVNEVEWQEADSLAGLGATDRKFITQTDDEGKTQIVFGNGREGARAPTGAGNIAAVYRSGIGRPGNVKAEQISLLLSRPLGVKEVINPLPASGGADKESRDQARENAPLALLALDRLVSVRDYADFSRTFAGIGKASAVRLSDGRRQVVHVTIAGADDIPIAEHSDLYRNLVQALQQLGEPHLPVEVKARELVLLVMSARVLPDAPWDVVEPRIRDCLRDTFSFGRRALGENVAPSDVISAIQGVRGVAYVDLDFLQGVTEARARTLLTRPPDAPPLTLQELAQLLADDGSPDAGAKRLPVAPVIAELARLPQPSAADRAILPAQLALLSPEVSATLRLEEIRP